MRRTEIGEQPGTAQLAEPSREDSKAIATVIGVWIEARLRLRKAAQLGENRRSYRKQLLAELSAYFTKKYTAGIRNGSGEKASRGRKGLTEANRLPALQRQ
jgi:hypothetical protein